MPVATSQTRASDSEIKLETFFAIFIVMFPLVPDFLA
jgi:hypothetical protein